MIFQVKKNSLYFLTSPADFHHNPLRNDNIKPSGSYLIKKLTARFIESFVKASAEHRRINKHS